MSNEDFKREWGMEITWADEENYCGKFLVFNNENQKTPFHMHNDTSKTWFVTVGKFLIRWINTQDGTVFQEEVNEGGVFKVPAGKPVSLESLMDNSTIVQVSNQNDSKDYLTILSANLIGSN